MVGLDVPAKDWKDALMRDFRGCDLLNRLDEIARSAAA